MSYQLVKVIYLYLSHGGLWVFGMGLIGLFLWGIFHSFVIYLYRIISKVNNHNLSFIKNFGFFITMPVIMLGWIPFRSTSLEQTFALYSIVFDLTSYDSLNLRENIYLICILILTGHILAYFISKKF